MGIKDQVVKLKDNWLLIVLVLVVLLLFSGIGNVTQFASKSFEGAMMMDVAESAMVSKGYYPSGGDFAPEVEERKIIKTTSMSTEVDRGEFSDADSKLKSIVAASDSIILNENVNKYGAKRKSYYTGSYQVKVDVEKYDSVIVQLKDIGEVKSFSESTDDTTGRYEDLTIELELEKEKLQKYNELYNELIDSLDKLDTLDWIYDQERRVKYLEDALYNLDKRIEYSTVYLTITEERSEYANIAVVKFSALVTAFVGSFNGLLTTLFAIGPWLILALIVWLIWKKFKK